MRERPEALEYDPFYSIYIDPVPDGNIVSILTKSAARTQALLASCPEDRERHRYAPGKWSIRELAAHIIDAERMYAYRALHFARMDPSPLPGMDAVLWAANSTAADRPLSHLVDEFATVRASTISLCSSFDATAWATTGVASGRRFSVRALTYVIAGHEMHHRRVLEERYLATA